MKFNHNLLFISSQYLDGDNPSQQVLEELQTELAERGFKIHITHQISDGLKIIEKSPPIQRDWFLLGARQSDLCRRATALYQHIPQKKCHDAADNFLRTEYYRSYPTRRLKRGQRICLSVL